MTVQDAVMEGAEKPIEILLNPRAVAVVGASNTPGKAGFVMLRNLLDYGYGGKIYPINPKQDEVLGLRCYRSAKEIKAPVDVAFVHIPAPGVPGALEDLGLCGVAVAVINTAGFRETGDEGEELERRCLEIARRHGMRIVGPNCTGILSTSAKLPWTRNSRLFPRVAGGVAFISHSGSMSGSFASLATARGLGFSHVISVGNELDLDSLDFLEFLKNDPATRMIVMFVEGIAEGRRLIDLARQTIPTKPILAWKVGRGTTGIEAVSSHTGRLAGSAAIYRAAFRQAGIVEALDFEELVDFTVALDRLDAVGGRGVAIVTGPGAPGVACADSCEEAGLEVPQYSQETREELARQFPDIQTTANPTNTEFTDFDRFPGAVAIASRDPGTDVVILAGPTEVEPEKFVAAARESARRSEKPVCIVWLAGGKAVDDAAAELEDSGLAVFRSPRRAARALAAVQEYRRYRERD